MTDRRKKNVQWDIAEADGRVPTWERVNTGSARVRGLWREFPPAHVWHIAPRPSFTGGKGTDGYEYVAIAWVKGHTGCYVGGWLEWSRG